MTIIFERNNLFSLIFPSLQTNEEIVQALQKYFQINSNVPKVEITDNLVLVHLPELSANDHQLSKAIKLCEHGQFAQAKIQLSKIIESNPSSEAFRMLGQIYSEEGDQDKAVNYLIDALRWDSKNPHALLMMGNIFVRFKNDSKTAKEYYSQVLKINPNDYITLSNIGATLLQDNQLADAKEYLLKAVKIFPYPNALYSLGVLCEQENNSIEALDYMFKALRATNQNEQLHPYVLNTLKDLCSNFVLKDNGQNIYENYIRRLEAFGGKKIQIEPNEQIPFHAKIEFAENYGRDYHLIKYKPSRKAIAHLIMHELVHLEFVLDARDKNSNKLFTSSDSNKRKFEGDLTAYLSKLYKMKISNGKILSVVDSLFEGFNALLYNAPIDLFIENKLFKEYSQLRPYQFLSLTQIISEGIFAVTNKELKELSPAAILSKTKIYNLLAAFQFKELFGLDFTSQYQASKHELDLARGFYNEFEEYRDDKDASEEYELIQHWAEDLHVDGYFKLVDENEHRSLTDIDTVVHKIQNDPYNLERSEYEDREMSRFLENHKNSGLNLAVVTYMIEALEYFKGMSKDLVKEIAFEIAMQGRQGYNPNGETYKLGKIANKTFTGYQILAYYYVSWAIAIPEMLSQLGLPFDEEYRLANSFYNT